MTTQEQISSQNKNNWREYSLTLVPAAIIYIYRSWFIFSDWLLLCIISFVFLGMILAMVINTLLSKKLSVIGLCALSIAISILAPHPEPEQVHLFLFRSEYQAVVELARNHQLGHEGYCQFAYVLPDEYSNLSNDKDGCIFVEYEPALVVVFDPLFSRQLLVYAESPEAVKEYISCGGSDGNGYFQLEENWYKCLQDWN